MKVKKIGIVSLSSGILGEDFIQHEVKLGKERLEKMGLDLVFLPHALKGMDYLQNHPQARAQDLLDAFQDDSIDMVLCAIGGEDTYKLLPYLFERNELKEAVQEKIFLGFSDTTINHLMLHKLGLKTFYGQAFLPDICELAKDMLPYTESYFKELIETGTIKEIRPSKLWYRERQDFSEKSLGQEMESYPDTGFELLKGPGKFKGKILGGCIESIYTIFDNSRFEDTVDLCEKYQLFPKLEDWKGKILLLETSEEKSQPAFYRKMVRALKDYGLFDQVQGVLLGKPQDKVYYEDYKKILLEELQDKDLSLVYNINVGHATPRCIVPFGLEAEVDVKDQVIRFES